MAKRIAVATSWLRSFTTLTVNARRAGLSAAQPPKPPYSTQWKRFASAAARRQRPILLTAGAGALSTALLISLTPAPKEKKEAEPTTAPTAAVPLWPRYSLSEIKQHDARSEAPWVTYDGSVYDITEWVAAHPGGDVILRAAGGAVEPYWDIFSIHKQHLEDVLAVLEGYKVGEVDEADLDGVLANVVEDEPFKDEPKRDPRLRTLTDRPRNAETPAEGLTAGFLTPTELFYVRNHMWVPVVEEADAHTITIETPDGEERTYTLRELRERFPMRKVTATLQCAGNRRRDMTERAGKTNGLQWTAGAVSTAEWEGVLLRDVLADVLETAAAADAAKFPGGVKHVHFVGLEAYAASIPITKALDPLGDVLLAFRMNGAPLPRDHGFPVRTIVPGNVAARSVKWLRRIALSDEESPSQWQRRDYKTFCPGVADPDWGSAPAIQEMPVTSAVTGAEMDGGVVRAEGYAYSGGGRGIARVDVSVDGGRTWRPAELVDDVASGRKAWCWKRWRYRGPVAGDGGSSGSGSGSGRGGPDRDADGGRIELVVKATDEAYNTQPESYGSIYNVRGNLATAWHRIEIERPKMATN